MMAKLLAEFLGTFALVFTVCHDDMSGSPLAALSVASALMVSVYALGGVSGAHFNPAVTFGLALAEKAGHKSVEVATAGLYMLVQVVAGALASVMAAQIWTSTIGGPSSTEAGTSAQIEAGAIKHPATALGTPGDFTHFEVFCAEVIYTAMLVFVVLNVATCGDQGKAEKNHYFAQSIGYVIVAGASGIGHITGCSLNPAVSAGVGVSYAIFAKGLPWRRMFAQFLLYSAAEMTGAAVAVALFVGVRRHVMVGNKETVATFSKLLSEFLGTYMLCLTVSLVVVQASAVPIVGVIGIAASLMVMVFSLGAVSGANFNPAVSFGLLLTGNSSILQFVQYVVAQILGGLLAVTTAARLEGKKWRVALVADVPDDKTHAEIDVLLAKGSWGAIFGAEVFYTLLLVFVVLNVAVREAPNQYYGLAIGFVIVVGGVAIGGLSGGCFNPAISLALDFGGVFSPPGARYGCSLVYIAAEILGATLASGLFLGVSQTEDDDSASISSGEDNTEAYEVQQKIWVEAS